MSGRSQAAIAVSWGGVLVTGIAAAGVALLAAAALGHEGPARLDPRIASEVLQHRSAALTVLFRALTFVGSEAVVGTLGIALLLVLLVRRRLQRAAVVALALGGAAALILAIKLWVARPRPPAVDRLGPVDQSYSLPSGHTVGTAVLVALVVWLLWPGRGPVVRALMCVLGTVTALGVAVSRVYLGYHWSTDVVASLLLAIGWLSLLWSTGRLRPGRRVVDRVPGASLGRTR